MALLNTIKSLFRKKKDEEQIGAQPTPTPVNLAPTPAPSPAPADLKPIDLKGTWEKIKNTIGNIDTGVKPSTGLFGIESGLGGDGFVSRDTSEPTIKVRELFDPQSYKGGNRVAKAAGVTLEDVMNATVPSASQAIGKGAITLKSIAKEIPKTIAIGESALAGLKYLKEGKLPSAEEVAVSAPFIALAGVQPTSESSIARADDMVSMLKNKLGVKSIDLMDETAAPSKVPWKNVVSALKEYTVDNKLLKRLEKGEVVEGDGFVLQKRGEQLIASIDKSFQPVKQAIKKVSEGVKLEGKIQEPVAPEIKWVDQKIFAKSLDRAKSAGKKKLVDIPEAGYWKPGELDRTQVEAVKSSLLGGDRINPIVLDPDGNVLDGAHRLQALKELGVKDVEVVVQKPLTPVVKPVETVAPTTPTQQPLMPEPNPEITALLPQGEIKVPTVAEAKRKFDTKGVRLDFVNKLKPNEEPINIPPGGVTGKQLYDPGLPVSEPSITFDKQYLNALTDEYGLVKTTGKGGLEVPPDLVAGLPNWKDKARIALNDFTPTRNVEDVAGADAPKLKEFFFDRVAQDTQKIQNELATIKRDVTEKVVDGLGIKAGSQEDKYVMMFGEGRMTETELRGLVPDKADNVIMADKYFRALYDGLLNKINESIGKFGYDPIKKRKDYYTHYQELGNLFEALGQVFRNDELPAWLNGLTADFKPGKQFFKFSQPRLGTKFTDSALGAIDQYLEPAMNQIYRTETVQRGRLLERVMSDALQKGSGPDQPAEHLTNFMAWIRDYTNSLAGKKTLMARGSEGLLGRPVYSVVNTLRQKTGANLVGANISAGLTNFIPFTQALATTEKTSFIKGLINSATKPLTETNEYMVDGIQSKFLRNRYDTPKLAPSFWDKAADKSTWLFQAIDRFVSGTIVSGKYFEGIGKGLDSKDAMNAADSYAAQVMADRSFGQMPQIFQNQGLLSLFTQFQLEVNNQIQYLARDIPKESGSLAKTASVLGQVAIYSWVFNNMFEYLTGRRPAFDPIDIAIGTVEDATSNNAPDVKRKEIAKRILQNIPFVNTLVNGGRIPIGSGLPTISEFQQDPIGATIKPVAIYGAPTGGYQIYKSYKGISDYIQGYKENASGAIQYPIEQNFMNLVRGLLFGPSSFPEASEYYKEGYSPLGTEQTVILKNLLDKNPELGQKYYERLQQQRQIQSQLGQISTLKNQLTIKLGDPNLSQEEKAIAQQEFQTAVADIQAGVIESLGTIAPPEAIPQISESLQTITQPPALEGSGNLPTVDFTQPTTTPLISVKGKKVAPKKVSLKVGKAIKFKTPKQKSVNLASVPGTKITPPPSSNGVRLTSSRKRVALPKKAPKVSGLRVS